MRAYVQESVTVVRDMKRYRPAAPDTGRLVEEVPVERHVRHVVAGGRIVASEGMQRDL